MPCFGVAGLVHALTIGAKANADLCMLFSSGCHFVKAAAASLSNKEQHAYPAMTVPEVSEAASRSYGSPRALAASLLPWR